MQIAESDQQSENAASPTTESSAGDSNVTVERDRQSEKHPAHISSTCKGIQIVESDEHPENPRRSMSES
jgi:hypothetical protein